MRRYGYGVTEKVLEQLVRSVIENRAPEHATLLDLVGSRPLTRDEREAIRDILADELTESGLGPDAEPNDRGLLLEAAIAWLGHK
jgi:hypothetical protein